MVRDFDLELLQGPDGRAMAHFGQAYFGHDLLWP